MFISENNGLYGNRCMLCFNGEIQAAMLENKRLFQ